MAKELFVVGCQVGANPTQLSEVTGMSRSAVSRRYDAARLKIEKKPELSNLAESILERYRRRLIENRKNRKPDPGSLIF